MPRTEIKPCFRCGKPSNDITSKNGYVSGGFDSDYDIETFVWITPIATQDPEGELCNACLGALILEGAVEKIYGVGPEKTTPSGAAHAALFRNGVSWLSSLLDKAKAFEDPDEGIRWLTQRMAPVRDENAHLAGMMFMLASAALGKAPDLEYSLIYGAAVEKEKREEAEILEVLLAEVEKQLGPDPSTDKEETRH